VAFVAWKASRKRVLWDGKYKPFYKITHLDEYLGEKESEECIHAVKHS